jgi:hypothetical protein
MGDASRADPALIPAYEWFGSPDWRSFYCYFHVKANWELCADNLLDLSHTPYVHTNTIGTPDMEKIPLETWVEGHKVLSRRKMKQVIPGPFVAEWGGFAGKIDRVTTCEWVPAGNISVESIRGPTNRMTIRLTNPLTPGPSGPRICGLPGRNFGGDDAAYVRSSEAEHDDPGRGHPHARDPAGGGRSRRTAADGRDHGRRGLLHARRTVQSLANDELAK